MGTSAAEGMAGPGTCVEAAASRRRPRGPFGAVDTPTSGRAPMGDQAASLTELVARARLGDQPAWDEIVARFGSLLWGVARSYRLESHAAGDVVQATWLRLVESLDRIRDPEALPGWLLTTVRREAIRTVRAHGREVLDIDDQPRERPDLDAVELDLHLLEDERDTELWRCFGRLTERCQRLLRILMSPECPPYAVVAGQLGVPIGSLGPTRGRCLVSLRELMRASDFDFGPAFGGGRAP
jgi:RNA polymerase sigma factor (sigma-70 family)